MTSICEIKLCLLGDKGVGKSSIVHRFIYDVFNLHIECTIGASFMTKNIVTEDYIFKFQIWDTAGQERYRSLAPLYYRNAKAALIVYDVTDKVSFKSLQSWIAELKKFGPDNLVIAIAGNKSDLEDRREVNVKEAADYAKHVNAIFYETSALTDENVSNIFIKICNEIRPEVNSSKQIGSVQTKNSKTCC